MDWLVASLPPLRAPAGDGARNLGMCPDPELNPKRSNQLTHPARAILFFFTITSILFTTGPCNHSVD